MGCEDRLNGLLRVLSKPNTSTAMSNHTIPLHCREANFWLDASTTNVGYVGYVGFTGSHFGCILLNFKALLSHLPNLEPMLSPVSQKNYSLLEPRSATGREGQCDSSLCSGLEKHCPHLIESLETSFPQANSRLEYGVSGVLMFLAFSCLWNI